jgi:hypothetical protein
MNGEWDPQVFQQEVCYLAWEPSCRDGHLLLTTTYRNHLALPQVAGQPRGPLEDVMS